MSVLDWCERLQETWLSQALSQSTWGYPIVGALHVLSIVSFGGFVWVTNLCALGLAFRQRDLQALTAEVRVWKGIGLSAVIVTGVLLFASLPVQYYNSNSFRIKMTVLALIAVNAFIAHRRPRGAASSEALHAGISLALWAAVILASRGIAFF